MIADPAPGELGPREAQEVTVSVIIPARNEEALVGKALSSVAAQRYPLDYLECVVVDNASTDQTLAVVDHFAGHHPELVVRLVAEPKVGVAAAKNKGARLARGSVLLFMDADSEMQPGLVADVARCYRAGLLAGSICVVANSQDLLERGFFALMELGKLLFGIRTQMAYCDRRLFWLLAGFREELRLAEDLDFLSRARAYLRGHRLPPVTHLRSSAIATSPRRLRALPCRLSLFAVFGRWALAYAGFGRARPY